MDLMEIVLVILGIALIIVSCILVDRNGKDRSTGSFNGDTVGITEDKAKELVNRAENVLSQASEDIVMRTEEQLNRISNEKIMAVSEFSDQVLEKIGRNHEEVIFLYQMLNQKEQELKDTIKDINPLEKENSNGEGNRRNAVKDKPVDRKKNRQAAADIITEEENIGNSNAAILELYGKGESIVDISRSLGLGQGEVKLVIDLFHNK